MDEKKFWLDLEWRVCRELAGMRDNRLRSLWCDGFSPESYLLNGVNPRITGKVWMAGGPDSQWDFTLVLRQPVASRDTVQWSTLLPAEDVTYWLSVDPENMCIEIDLASAISDASREDHVSARK